MEDKTNEYARASLHEPTGRACLDNPGGEGSSLRRPIRLPARKRLLAGTPPPLSSTDKIFSSKRSVRGSRIWGKGDWQVPRSWMGQTPSPPPPSGIGVPFSLRKGRYLPSLHDPANERQHIRVRVHSKCHVLRDVHALVSNVMKKKKYSPNCLHQAKWRYLRTDLGAFVQPSRRKQLFVWKTTSMKETKALLNSKACDFRVFLFWAPGKQDNHETGRFRFI